MRARFTPSRTEGAPVDATVDLIFPVADPTAQTTRVRLTVKNPRGTPAEVRPGDFGTVELLPPPRDLLAVPRDALVDTAAEHRPPGDRLPVVAHRPVVPVRLVRRRQLDLGPDDERDGGPPGRAGGDRVRAQEQRDPRDCPSTPHRSPYRHRPPTA